MMRAKGRETCLTAHVPSSENKCQRLLWQRAAASEAGDPHVDDRLYTVVVTVLYTLDKAITTKNRRT